MPHSCDQNNQESESVTPWTYYYPIEDEQSSEGEGRGRGGHSRDSVILQPFSGVNIVISISERSMRNWVISRDKGASTVAIAKELIGLVRLHWSILGPMSTHPDALPARLTTQSCYRIGQLVCPSIGQDTVDSLFLPPFMLSLSLVGGPPSSIPTNVSARKFHRFEINICLSASALSCFEPSSPVSKSHKVELVVAIICAGSASFQRRDAAIDMVKAGERFTGLVKCGLGNSFIISGSPHILLDVPDSPCLGDINLKHAISVCFTRCGTYSLYVLGRLQPCDDFNSSLWWIPQSPLTISAQ
jgi:hypothetical protein